ncbi:hypothetical protein ACOMHN_034027 [Nucella lapillus]
MRHCGFFLDLFLTNTSARGRGLQGQPFGGFSTNERCVSSSDPPSQSPWGSGESHSTTATLNCYTALFTGMTIAGLNMGQTFCTTLHLCSSHLGY